MSPSLSIVIPSHNRPDLLDACLRTVTLHAPKNTEIIVVDDASPELTVSRVASRFPVVQVLRLPKQKGFCAAVNAGIRAASGAIVEVLNDDTEVSPGWAAPVFAAFEDSGVAAVAPLVLYWQATADRISPPLVDSAGDCYYVGGIAGKRGHGLPLGASHLRRGLVFGASASSAFFRRAVLLEVGAFPESFGAYFEDVDLAFRLHWAGYQILYEPASRVFHHVSASYGSPQRGLLEQQSQNEERVFWRNLPSRALLRALPHHFAVVFAKAWRRWQEGNLAPFLRGRLRVLGEARLLVQHRSQLRRTGRSCDLSEWQVDQRFKAVLERVSTLARPAE